MHIKFSIFILYLTFSILHCQLSIAQQFTQTIRGTVVDKVTNTPLPGANVVLLNSNPVKGTSTDLDGNFKLTQVPVGKQSIRITYMGYKELLIPNIDLNSGKEMVLNIALDENYVLSKEAIVTAKIEKEKPLNEMSTVSSRTFSVEETQKFAAAVNDPGRMATSFAGVVGTDDGNNTISIRGNSPTGLQWRMEGVEIPSPNHFSPPGSSGGGISILNSQLLTNSDFSTGAFAAEYGNALSGVFDLKLRKGNNEKREYSFTAGLLGIEAGAEGPFKKGYSGSYLINYRYSTLSVLGKLGVPLGDAVTNFQDLSYNISLPTNHAGNFTLFGFGGLSSQLYNAKKDSTQWKSSDESYNSNFFGNTGAAGITHSYSLNEKAYLKSAFVVSDYDAGYTAEKLEAEYQPTLKYAQTNNQTKFTLQSTLNYKFNARQSLRTGVIVNKINYSINEKGYDSDINAIRQTINTKGTAYTLQLYGQTQYHLSEKLTFNAGLHFLELLTNQTYSVEPRASLKYEFSNLQSLSFGYGMHSQLQPTGVYFAQFTDANGSIIHPNKNLGLTKANHFVLAYDRSITEFIHAKVETYYQQLYKIPVSANVENSFSMVNVDNGYMTDSLINKGTGGNYGVDVTVEQYLHHNFYFLLSTSLYDSKYKGSDHVLRNTRYNGGYAVTFTAGKEIKTGDKFKNRVIGINIKTIYRGGFRDTPIDLEASQNSGNDETKYIDSEAYTIKYAPYFRTDIRFSIKRNRAKSTQTLALDIQNVTNRKNIYGQYYNSESKSIKTYYQAPLIPILSYKVEF